MHAGDDLFRGIPARFSAVRYHSLAVVEPLPPELRKIAWNADGMVMALRHISRPLWGVQFHPESICTEYGIDLVRNFLSLSLAHAPGSVTAVPSRACKGAVRSPSITVKAKIRKVASHHSPETLFRSLFVGEQFSFWLDSAMVTGRSRFSYMGAAPDTYRSQPGDSVFDWLGHSLHQTRIEAPEVPFPFTGGYIGYFGYELKAECGAGNKHRSDLPDAILLRVERFLVIDHLENKLYVVCAGEDAESWLDDMEHRIACIDGSAPAPASNYSKSAARFSIPEPEYLDRIRDCLSFIAAGESYELCLTNKVLLDTDVPALEYYETLRRMNPAPYAAYLNLGDIQVASSSPECFLRIDASGRAESRPIKGIDSQGTRRRRRREAARTARH